MTAVNDPSVSRVSAVRTAFSAGQLKAFKPSTEQDVGEATLGRCTGFYLRVLFISSDCHNSIAIASYESHTIRASADLFHFPRAA